MLNSFLSSYFGFNKQQRGGIFVLVLISVCLLFVRLIYPVFIKPDNIVLLNLPLIEKKQSEKYDIPEPASKSKYSTNPESSQLFVFDPNTVSFEQLLLLGFSERTAQIFLKFKSKGFVFKQKKDLRKVYGISNDLYTQLEPYILIGETATKQYSEKQETHKPNEKKAKNQITTKIELNTADSAQLVAVYGIGAVYAKRILKYRSILGGYVAVEQLKEVYGFTDELYEKVKSYFYADAVMIKKIDLNKDDFKTVNKHPYLTYEVTKGIFDWRRKTTITPANIKELLNDNSLYQKLLPYLHYE